MCRSGVWCAIAVVWMALVMGAPAHAQRKHTVKQGQTLGAIAKRYKVSVMNLAAANRLKKTSSLRVGQVLRVPPKGVVFVYPGQTLSGLAKANKVSVKALAKANRLKPDATLRVGQRLELPGYRARAQETESRNAKLGGLVILERPANHETLRVKLFDSKGKVIPKGRQKLARFLRDRESGEVRRPHVRLMRVLSYLSDRFNGRTIEVVSAYRSPKSGGSESSRHATGEAVDIRVEGVPNEVLRDYCLTLSRLGVGYYPRSSFVHIDVRPQAAYWVDWSRPGEPALYLPPGQSPEEFDAGTPTAVSPPEGALGQ
ncbi:MAG: LysM peptidoglycan-binding domain-containing protein [Myxococcota bacterium]